MDVICTPHCLCPTEQCHRNLTYACTTRTSPNSQLWCYTLCKSKPTHSRPIARIPYPLLLVMTYKIKDHCKSFTGHFTTTPTVFKILKIQQTYVTILQESLEKRKFYEKNKKNLSSLFSHPHWLVLWISLLVQVDIQFKMAHTMPLLQLLHRATTLLHFFTDSDFTTSRVQNFSSLWYYTRRYSRILTVQNGEELQLQVPIFPQDL